MSDDDFNAVFGRRPEPRPTFVERVTRPAGPKSPSEAPSTSTAETTIAAEALAALGEYRAFGSIPHGQFNPSCEVRSWMDGTVVPDGTVFFYRLLLQIGFTGDDELRLMLPDSTIVISGRKLDPLRLSLTRNQATFVQSFNPSIWPCRREPAEPWVERIEIIRAGN